MPRETRVSINPEAYGLNRKQYEEAKQKLAQEIGVSPKDVSEVMVLQGLLTGDKSFALVAATFLHALGEK